MKILVADILLAGKPHSDWKEGYEFCYALRNLGHECDVYGPNGEKSEIEIPFVAHLYDLVIITENYWTYSDWKWWDWSKIKTPKLFWAIDTHIVDYRPFIQQGKIDFVAFNNKEDFERYNLPNSFWMPLAVSKIHYGPRYISEKTRDLALIGGMIPERKIMCEKFGIEHLMAFGDDYIKEMQRTKICFNLSMSYDMNSKYFEIIAAGSFMLTNYNENFHKFVDYNEDVSKMFYYSDDDLSKKIKYYLENEQEREDIAKRASEYVLENHSFEKRCELIFNNIKLKEKNL
jgi:hypothetical protein